MAKITIELTEDNKTVVTYDNGSIVYPICDIDKSNFHISEETNVLILSLVADVIHNCGMSINNQLIKQGFVNSR
jgi:hypothetical protein